MGKTTNPLLWPVCDRATSLHATAGTVRRLHRERLFRARRTAARAVRDVFIRRGPSTGLRTGDRLGAGHHPAADHTAIWAGCPCRAQQRRACAGAAGHHLERLHANGLGHGHAGDQQHHRERPRRPAARHRGLRHQHRHRAHLVCLVHHRADRERRSQHNPDHHRDRADPARFRHRQPDPFSHRGIRRGARNQP